MKLIPSLASADVLNLRSAIESLGDWPFLHLDIEDGNFIDNITFGLKVVKNVVELCKTKEIDVHLEVLNPMKYLEKLKEMGITRVSTQIEALESPQLFIAKCKNLEITPGFAILSNTKVDSYLRILNEADYLIFMTVDSEDPLQMFSEEAFKKVLYLLDSKKLKPEVYADGALGKKQLSDLYEHGAAGAVLGRLVFSNGNALTNLREIENGYCKNT